jgi:hypothetical protein
LRHLGIIGDDASDGVEDTGVDGVDQLRRNCRIRRATLLASPSARFCPARVK